MQTIDKLIILFQNHDIFIEVECLVLLQVPKCFVPVQIFCVGPKFFLHIMPVTNILYQTKRWFAFSKIGFCAGTNVFEEALFKCSQILGPDQKIWTGTKHFGKCKRTRHWCTTKFFNEKYIYIYILFPFHSHWISN